MSKKVVLKHDPISGSINDANGVMCGTWVGDLESFEPEANTTVDDLVKLREAGFTVDDIVNFRATGIL